MKYLNFYSKKGAQFLFDKQSTRGRGIRDLSTLSYLLNPENGFYDEESDVITVEIWLKVNKAFMKDQCDENNNRSEISDRHS
jgi:hypothetical protein